MRVSLHVQMIQYAFYRFTEYLKEAGQCLDGATEHYMQHPAMQVLYQVNVLVASLKRCCVNPDMFLRLHWRLLKTVNYRVKLDAGDLTVGHAKPREHLVTRVGFIQYPTLILVRLGHLLPRNPTLRRSVINRAWHCRLSTHWFTGACNAMPNHRGRTTLTPHHGDTEAGYTPRRWQNGTICCEI